MQPALLIRLRPLGPWRSGSSDGADHRADALYASDRLYSAVSLAMQQLGWLQEWLEATARAERSAAAFSSLFPFQADTLFAPPPATLWPPPPHLVRAPNPAFLAKIRWSAARLVPLAVIESLATGQSILADQWMPDAESGCLLRRDRPSSNPFRRTTRTSAAVDRLTRASALARKWRCVEFESASGLWTVARFSDLAAHSLWRERVTAAFRLLADTGFGGGRSHGYGQCAAPEFRDGPWPGILLPKLGARNGNGSGEAALFWTLSLYWPARRDEIDWSSGEYQLVTRAGRVAGAGAPKKVVRMVAAGSVLAAASEPVGAAVDVRPDAFPHPVYRSGVAVAMKLPVAETGSERPVETPTDEEAVEPHPCEPPHESQTETTSDEV
jgi:CRISPR type III-A-associated RAMP protein Csm4